MASALGNGTWYASAPTFCQVPLELIGERRRSPYLATMGAALAFAFLGLIVIGLVSPH
jgi:hypothetical protein